MDITIPNNNENEFVAMARKLGYKTIYFLYDLDRYSSTTKNFTGSSDIHIINGILADDKNIKKIKNNLEDKNVFVAIKSSNKDREVIEGSLADLVFSLEDSPKKDFIHQRASGLNHILCRLARKNNITIGFSFSSILNAENKHEVLGRITQNLRMCKRFEVKTIIASFARNPYEMRSMHDLTSLFKVLER